MPVVNIQPGVFQSPDQKTPWSSGICDCCEDIQICCFGFWCPWCLLCQISSDFGECFCLCMLDWFSGCIPATSMALRSTLRERFRIQGSICSDCAVVTFCTQCSWCQMAREIKLRRRPFVFASAPTSVQIHMHPNQPTAFPNAPPIGFNPPGK
ncbi:hypothetical protein DPEC_G00104170 [Dallia pectoralis]|uniref:Uncharacterized protein n=1 Tax=Dallia pectoralis TaxID=75939 RepID=A0ACC2GY40_DALPE|nr:hypothetical protein DPEC_G00104170 [Dallia pectoralis]